MWVTMQCLASAHVISLESVVEFTNCECFRPCAGAAAQPGLAREPTCFLQPVQLEGKVRYSCCNLFFLHKSNYTE